MIESLETLRALIAGAVAEAECEVDRVTVTAGRPPAPAGDDCTVIYIFADQVTDLDQNNPAKCAVRSRLTMNYEIHVCYITTPEDETDAQHEVGADCLYELMSLVWCGLVAAKDDKAFGDCSWVELAPLNVQERRGGSVSALGGLTIPLDC